MSMSHLSEIWASLGILKLIVYNKCKNQVL